MGRTYANARETNKVHCARIGTCFDGKRDRRGLACTNYWVNAHYTAPTTGSSYWYGWQYGTWGITQSPGYPVDQAWHDTDYTSPFLK